MIYFTAILLAICVFITVGERVSGLSMAGETKWLWVMSLCFTLACLFEMA